MSWRRPSLRHLRRMTDDFGLIQFGRGKVPDRASGYTADDNARALVVSARFGVDDLADVYLRFLERSQRENGWFHNLWDEQLIPIPEIPSEDCQGRCLWALAEVVYASNMPLELKRRAKRLLIKTLPTVYEFSSIRGKANALLGLAKQPNPRPTTLLAEALVAQFSVTESAWPWPESILTYELARVPHGLLECARRFNCATWLETALCVLDFLIQILVEDDMLVLVGNRGWYVKGQQKSRFGQQPVDAGALVEACVAAYRISMNPSYLRMAELALGWFHGRNTAGVSLVDPDGTCRDGIDEHGVSENCGAESCLAYLLACSAWCEVSECG
ncbi:MAG: hypothetical protein N3A55_04145 [Methylohalobius sp.]|nr:hypothetical protein [Methylohalobius sp.]